MLYTEEGLYLEWKVVSFRVDRENHNLQNKLVRTALQPVMLGIKLVLQGKPTALLFSTFACKYPVCKPIIQTNLRLV